jgi:hypothetical protein
MGVSASDLSVVTMATVKSQAIKLDINISNLTRFFALGCSILIKLILKSSHLTITMYSFKTIAGEEKKAVR